MIVLLEYFTATKINEIMHAHCTVYLPTKNMIYNCYTIASYRYIVVTLLHAYNISRRWEGLAMEFPTHADP